MVAIKKTFPKLYKYTATGQIQEWQIFSEDGSYWTVEGLKDGKLTTSLPTACEGKNIGRSNETGQFDQAEKEAQAKWQKKVDKGYNEKLTSEKLFFEPMLAKDAKESKDLVEPFKVRVFVQPKLDGLRAVNTENTLMSRNGKPYVACPHLYQDFVLEDHIIFDGELYTHAYKDDFNKIVSLCKRQKPTPLDLEESRQKVQFWVYDLPSINGVFSKRFTALCGILDNPDLADYKGKFVPVPTYEVKSWDDIGKFHSKFCQEGYEGTIIRLDLGPYENKRSKQLLKYKDFVDEEFKILGFEEGDGGRAGTIGFFTLQHDKNPNQTFKSNVKGNFDYLKQIWKDRESYIGATATVKYFNRTPKQDDGTGDVPRFPYIVKLKREEYE